MTLETCGVAERVAAEQGQGWKLPWLEYARAVVEVGLGHYEEALAAAPRAYEDNLLISAFALPDLIEAAVRCGERSFAAQAVERVARRTGEAPMSKGLLARSRALLEDGPDAAFVVGFNAASSPRCR